MLFFLLELLMKTEGGTTLKTRNTNPNRALCPFDWIVSQTNLFGFLLNVNDSVLPIAKMGSHENVDLRQQTVPDHVGAHESKQSPSHVPVGEAMDCCNVAFS